MAARKISRTHRLSPETIARLELISEARDGLDHTRIIENAVERYAASMLGRRQADLVAVKLRDRPRPG